MTAASARRPPAPPAPSSPPEPPTRPRRRRSWIRRVLVNGALFAVGGTIALIGLRIFAALSPPATAPLAPAPADSAIAAESAAPIDSTITLDSATGLPRHAPVVVYSAPRVGPVFVMPPLRPPIRLPAPPKSVLLPLSPMARARAGGSVRVNVTAYCLKGTTRRDHQVRAGIVAADPRYFPLGRYIDLTIGFGYHGRYLVDDTGKDIQGLRLDVWTESCAEARRFGRRFGSAKLVPR